MDREENIKGRASPKIGCMNCNGLGDKLNITFDKARLLEIYVRAG